MFPPSIQDMLIRETNTVCLFSGARRAGGDATLHVPQEDMGERHCDAVQEKIPEEDFQIS